MTGMKESSRLPTTSRVRNFDPSTPSLRSANNLIRLRNSTNVRAPKSSETSNVNATSETVCWFVLGLMNRSSNDERENRIPNSGRPAAASHRITFLRLGSRDFLRSAISQRVGNASKDALFDYVTGT